MYPSLVIASQIVRGPVSSVSYLNFPRWVVNATSADVTPGSFPTVVSILLTQDAQVIPLISNSHSASPVPEGINVKIRHKRQNLTYIHNLKNLT